jgi:prolipoprotein diacylglyceryltransferase
MLNLKDGHKPHAGFFVNSLLYLIIKNINGHNQFAKNKNLVMQPQQIYNSFYNIGYTFAAYIFEFHEIKNTKKR